MVIALALPYAYDVNVIDPQISVGVIERKYEHFI